MRIALLVLALGACQGSDVSRSIGARCDTNADCNERCLAPGGAWPGGFCTISCDADAACGDHALCIDEEGGVCAFSCATDADCAFLGGYHCVAVDRRAGGNKVMVCRGN